MNHRRTSSIGLLAFTLSAVIASCDEPTGPHGSGSSGGEIETPSTPEAVAIRGILDVQLAAVRRGDGNGFAAPYVDDVVVLGPFAAHTLLDRASLTAAIGETFRQYLDAGRQATVMRTESHIGVSPTGQAGWAFERVSVVARGVETLFAVSTVLVHRGSAWRIAAQTWASPVEDEMAIDLASGGGFPAPARFDENTGPGAAAARQHVRAFVESRETWPEGEREDTMMIGTAPAEIARGDEAIGAQITREHAAGTRIEMAGGVHARSVGDGSVVFAAWVGAVVIPRRPPVRLPVRTLDVFVREEGGGYRIVMKHVSLGAPGFRGPGDVPQPRPGAAPTPAPTTTPAAPESDPATTPDIGPEPEGE